MRRSFLPLFPFVVLFWSKGVAEVSQYPTDLELTQRAVEEAVARAMAGLPSLEPDRVVLREDGTCEGGWMVESALAGYFKQRGWEVLLGEPPASPYEGGAFSYRVINLGMSYGQRHRRGIFGKSLVERHARAELSVLFAKLPSGEVLWVDQARGEVRDQVPEEELEALRSGHISLHPEELKEEERSFLEPLIVTALVGALIYLFYSTKSTQ